MCVLYLTFVDILYEASACTSCVGLILTFSMMTVLCETKSSFEEYFGIILLSTSNLRNFGIKIGYLLGVSGCKSTKQHCTELDRLIKGSN